MAHLPIKMGFFFGGKLGFKGGFGLGIPDHDPLAVLLWVS